MDLTRVRHRLEAREEGLSPFASRSRDSRGRDCPEEPSPVRTEFQRDRDRIIHTHAFRRLMHKTQVFIAPLGDHYVTRLTHTLEVTQIARTIGRALDLNEDLLEAMCLGHDLGHTPFGHVGERTLDALYPGGFRHNRQSLRIVERLEKQGRGLNLTPEVRQGIVAHSKPRGDFLSTAADEDLTLEAQVCRVSDAVAYLNHDIGDAVRADLLTEPDLPPSAREVLGDRHAQRIDTMVSDVVAASWAATGEGRCPEPVEGAAGSERPVIGMGPAVRQAFVELREFLFERVYLPIGGGPESRQASDVVTFLYEHFLRHPDSVPPEYWPHADSTERAVVDFLSGMTDRYALRLAEELKPGLASENLRWRV